MPAHWCPSYPCPICNPIYPTYYVLPPAPAYYCTPGCVCPPTSEKTCQSRICPRKDHLQAAPAIGTNN